MRFRFSNLKLRVQIFAVGAVAACGFIAILALSLWSSSERTVYEANTRLGAQLALESARAGQDFLQLRRHEKDFLLRLEEKYLASHNASEKEARERMAGVKAMAVRLNDRGLIEAINRIDAPLNEYSQDFKRLVELRLQLGVNGGSGLEKEMNNAAGEMEKKVANLEKPGLDLKVQRLRRVEKDFILYRNNADAKLAGTLGKELMDAVANEDLPLADKIGLKSIVEAYLRAFDAWAKMAVEFAEMQKATSGAYAKLEPFIKTATQRADELAVAMDERGREFAAHNFLVTIAIVAIAFLACALFSFAVWRYLTHSLASLETATRRLADGDLDTPVATASGSNEIAHLLTSLGMLRTNLIAGEEARNKQAKTQETDLRRSREIARLTQSFESEIGDVVAAVSGTSQELSSAAEMLSGSAEEATRQSASVATSAEEATSNVQTVAAAAEELAASIAEIGRRVNETSTISSRAVEEAADASRTVHSLSSAGEKIGNIINLIQTIAAQTNLLALNATIEAARAGEAGKGFAVVAAEVKTLARNTSDATGQIAALVGEIQSTTASAVSSITRISGTIDTMNGVAAAIAAAVEEQSATTQEIALRAAHVAEGTTEVSSNISGVLDASRSTTAAAERLSSNSSVLAHKASDLSQIVAGFLQDVRAA